MGGGQRREEDGNAGQQASRPASQQTVEGSEEAGCFHGRWDAVIKFHGRKGTKVQLEVVRVAMSLMRFRVKLPSTLYWRVCEPRAWKVIVSV